MTKVKVLGYSERGVFNSIVFYLREHADRIQDFIKILGIKNEDDFFNDACEYTFLNEQSFSQFGSNDLTVIAEGRDGEKKVIFIEGKVKTYGRKSFSLDTDFNKLLSGKTFDGISSNIFVQLYYKYLLTQVLEKKSVNTESLNLPDILKKNNRQGEKGPRQIGENGIVKNAIEKIKSAKEYYYVAILPIKDNPNLITEYYKKLNKSLLSGQQMATKNIYQVFWGSIEEHFKDVEQIKENFNFNYDKEKKNGQIY
jgi:hypothetical protein